MTVVHTQVIIVHGVDDRVRFTYMYLEGSLATHVPLWTYPYVDLSVSLQFSLHLL